MQTNEMINQPSEFIPPMSTSEPTVEKIVEAPAPVETLTVGNDTFDIETIKAAFESAARTGVGVIKLNDDFKFAVYDKKGLNGVLDKIEDAFDLGIAEERWSHFDPSKLISDEDMRKKYGITDEDLEGWEEVEFE